MITEHQASRTLVKSPPELWDECSDGDSLTRHLNRSFGEIRITRLEPETSVAWEGEHASGTVRIEPSGWGTRVTLTAQTEAEAAVGVETDSVEEEVDAVVEETVADPDPALAADSVAAGGRLKRLAARTRAVFRPRPLRPEEELVAPDPSEPPPLADPAEVPDPPEPLTPPEPPEPRSDPQAILSAALESLGQAHHRPFSRA